MEKQLTGRERRKWLTSLKTKYNRLSWNEASKEESKQIDQFFSERATQAVLKQLLTEGYLNPKAISKAGNEIYLTTGKNSLLSDDGMKELDRTWYDILTCSPWYQAVRDLAAFLATILWISTMLLGW